LAETEVFMRRTHTVHVLAAVAALGLSAACGGNPPASPTAASPVSSAVSPGAAGGGGSLATLAGGPPQVQTGVPSGEHVVGNAAIEPAYNADTGELMYLLTPEKVPLPSKANGHATSPLYLVEYPAGSTAAGGGHFNCEGVPGNCPDHDGAVAGAAVQVMPAVYGTDPTTVLGHDHIADPPGKPDFNIAWEVIEVLFTPKALTDDAVNTRLTTDTAVKAAVQAGDAIEVDLGFAFNCSVVPASLYWKGAPVS
jgi:hypothetical protein